MEMLSECLTALDQYGLRSFGIGERGLPGATNTRGGAPINLCNMTVLIGSGMLRNILFGLISLSTGFFLALSLGFLVWKWVSSGAPRGDDESLSERVLFWLSLLAYVWLAVGLGLRFFIGT